MATIEETHPDYDSWLLDWELMEDCEGGERAVKDRGSRYLPPTAGMEADGLQNENQEGYKAYRRYITRARFPELVGPALGVMVGVMGTKPPKITVPDSLAPMLERCSKEGESAEVLLRRIHRGILNRGRLGLLVDLPNAAAGVDVMPYISVYEAQKIRNWDERDGPDGRKQLYYLVLDESGNARAAAGGGWTSVKKYLELMLDPVSGKYTAVRHEETSAGVMPTMTVLPNFAGNQLDFIPFTCAGPLDLTIQPDRPPLLPLANSAIGIYRLEADYRQALFIQGQDTLVLIGGDDGKTYRLGAEAIITLPVGSDAKYVGAGSGGLPEMREALQNDKAEAAQLGAQLLRTSSDAEAAETLRIRLGSQTADLTTIARSAASALEQALRHAAIMKGMTPEQAKEQVSVEPNLDFVNTMLAASELLQMIQAKNLGAPISLRTIHDVMRQRELTSLEYEDELDEIGNEKPIIAPTGGTTGDPGSDAIVE